MLSCGPWWWWWISVTTRTLSQRTMCCCLESDESIESLKKKTPVDIDKFRNILALRSLQNLIEAALSSFHFSILFTHNGCFLSSFKRIFFWTQWWYSLHRIDVSRNCIVIYDSFGCFSAGIACDRKRLNSDDVQRHKMCLNAHCVNQCERKNLIE